MNIDWPKAPPEAQWYQPATGLSNAPWLYQDHEFSEKKFND